MSRLVVVSNRVATPRRANSGAQGGLAVALQSALTEWGGVWFGWSGELREAGERRVAEVESGPVRYVTVDLTQQDYEEYYNGFANQTLWPLFHYRLDLTEFSRSTMHGYHRVNHLFAEQLLPLLEPDDLIWIHDYHLIPLAEQLRNAGCRQKIGFFLHIPWPALEVFLALPNHREIVRSLCAYDLLGFQTENDVRGFRNYIEQETEGHVEADGTIHAFDRRLCAKAFPISIDTGRVAQFAAEAGETWQVQRLKSSLKDRELMIGVDRLDYSKGLPQRFRAYEQLLQNYPSHHGRVVFMQIAPPSRQDVPDYMQMRTELETLAGHINSSYAEFDWTPLRYLNKGFTRPILMGFLRMARVGLVTPLRDGMNLVAKEYVAAQDADDPGVLVLSRFAGSAAELDGAVMVNPYDVEGMAEAMQAALTMPLDERRERWERMMRRLRSHDVETWSHTYLEALVALATDSNGLGAPAQ